MMPFWDRKHRPAIEKQQVTQPPTRDAKQQMGDGTGRRTGHSLRHFLRTLKKTKKRTSQYEQSSLPDGQPHKPSTPQHHPTPSPPPPMVRRISSRSEKQDAITDKALPPTPPEMEQQKAEVKQPPLQKEDIQALFSGAPHFTTEAVNGKLQAIASFPWNTEPNDQDASDCPPLAHPAFSAATLRKSQPSLSGAARSKDVLEYIMGPVELPSMLSFQGFEVGSVGHEYFLELPKADSHITDEEDSKESNGLSEETRNKELFYASPEKLGIRRFDITMVYERLVEISDVYQAARENGEGSTILDASSAGELYATLFGKFLTPPRFDPNAGDPTGLKVQIETLLKILKLRGLWYNFSIVEWRIRLGQLLWTLPDPALSADDPLADPDWQWNERSILLLQLLLSCELFLRLDVASSIMGDDASQHLNPDELKDIYSAKTPKTDWDLVLAQRFLQEIQVVEETPLPPTPRRRGFFSSMTSETDEALHPHKRDIIFLGRNQSRQLSGLAYFAAAIAWPNIDTLFDDLSNKLDLPDLGVAVSGGDSLNIPTSLTISSIYATPMATPRSTSVRSSYFGPASPSRPMLSRDSTQRSVVLQPSSTSSESDATANIVNIGGWLSRSYMTGLVLPGEAMSHLLISTLLENDSMAVSTLGDSASLYGGFAYAGCSWWSKNCVVGKVLAASEGATECMGWIMTKWVPKNWDNGWIDISSNTVPLINRLTDELSIRTSLVKGTEDITDVQSSDLTLPLDGENPSSTEKETEIRLLDLHLEPTKEVHFKVPSDVDSHVDHALSTEEGHEHEPEPEPSIYNATLRFSIPYATSEDINPDLVDHGDAPDPLTDRSDPQIHSLNIRNDVYFVSAYPCVPPSTANSTLLKVPSDHPSTPTTPGQRVPAHPLHSSYSYQTIFATSLVNPDPDAVGLGAMLRAENEEVIVVDATACIDAGVLARAWCSEKGFNALIARRGRTCIGCAIREASGLGIKVVIRVA